MSCILPPEFQLSRWNLKLGSHRIHTELVKFDLAHNWGRSYGSPPTMLRQPELQWKAE